MVKYEHLRSGCDAEKSTALRAQDEEAIEKSEIVQRQQKWALLPKNGPSKSGFAIIII